MWKTLFTCNELQQHLLSILCLAKSSKHILKEYLSLVFWLLLENDCFCKDFDKAEKLCMKCMNV